MMGGYIRAIQHHLIAEFASQAFAEAVFIHHYAFYCATYSDCLFKSYSTDYWCSDYGAYVFIFGIWTGLRYLYGDNQHAYDNRFIHYDRFIQLLCLVLWS